MKKILALTLAPIMAAGMTTVAFALDTTDEDIAIGILPRGTGDQGDISNNEDWMFVLDEDDIATQNIASKGMLEGGDRIAFPMVYSDGEGEFGWYTVGTNFSKREVYTKWDVGEVADVEFKCVRYDLDSDVAQRESIMSQLNGIFDGSSTDTDDVRIWSVVVTLPENNDDHVEDLAGTIKVGRTYTIAKRATDLVEVELSYAPDGTDHNIDVEFTGDDVLPTGFTGIVAFADNLGEIDIEFGEEAMFTVDVTGQGRLNLSWDTSFDKEFADYYEYANLDFLNFSGEPRFNRNGYFYLFADEDAFIYVKGADGAEDANAEWDEDMEAWRIRTRELTSYVISDVELDEKTVTEDDTSSSTTDGGKVNPDTGR